MSGQEELEVQTEGEGAPETVTPEAAPEPQASQPAAVAAEPALSPPVLAPPQPHSVPLDVLLRTREELGGRLTQTEQRALAAERELAAIRKREQEQAAEIPNPLDEPEKFAQWYRNSIAQTRRDLEQRFERARVDDRLQTSRELIEDQLKPEEFKQLCSFIDTRPQQWHAHAEKQPHPYRWALKQMREAEKAKRSEEVLSKLGEKSLEELIEEQVAARLAASQAAAAEPAAVEAPAGQPRNPDGTFTSPSQSQQRRTAPSLATVNGAAASRGEPASGYDAAFRRG